MSSDPKQGIFLQAVLLTHVLTMDESENRSLSGEGRKK